MRLAPRLLLIGSLPLLASCFPSFDAPGGAGGAGTGSVVGGAGSMTSSDAASNNATASNAAASTSVSSENSVGPGPGDTSSNGVSVGGSSSSASGGAGGCGSGSERWVLTLEGTQDLATAAVPITSGIIQSVAVGSGVVWFSGVTVAALTSPMPLDANTAFVGAVDKTTGLLQFLEPIDSMICASSATARLAEDPLAVDRTKIKVLCAGPAKAAVYTVTDQGLLTSFTGCDSQGGTLVHADIKALNDHTLVAFEQTSGSIKCSGATASLNATMKTTDSVALFSLDNPTSSMNLGTAATLASLGTADLGSDVTRFFVASSVGGKVSVRGFASTATQHTLDETGFPEVPLGDASTAKKVPSLVFPTSALTGSAGYAAGNLSDGTHATFIFADILATQQNVVVDDASDTGIARGFVGGQNTLLLFGATTVGLHSQSVFLGTCPAGESCPFWMRFVVGGPSINATAGRMPAGNAVFTAGSDSLGGSDIVLAGTYAGAFDAGCGDVTSTPSGQNAFVSRISGNP